MAHGPGAGARLGYGLERNTGIINIPAIMPATRILKDQEKDHKDKPALFPPLQEKESMGIIKGEIVCRPKKLRGGSSRLVPVMSLLNNMGSKELAVFPDDPDMAMELVLAELGKIGIAWADAPIQSRETVVTPIQEIAVAVSGVVSVPTWTNWEVGQLARIIAYLPSSTAEKSYKPGGQDWRKARLIFVPIDNPDDMHFSRVLERNFRLYNERPKQGHRDNAYVEYMNTNRAVGDKYLEAMQQVHEFPSVSLAAGIQGLKAFKDEQAGGTGNRALDDAIDGMARQLEALVNVLGLGTASKRMTPAQNSARTHVARAVFLGRGDVRSPSAIGWDNARRANMAMAGKSPALTAMGRALEKQMNNAASFGNGVSNLHALSSQKPVARCVFGGPAGTTGQFQVNF